MRETDKSKRRLSEVARNATLSWSRNDAKAPSSFFNSLLCLPRHTHTHTHTHTILTTERWVGVLVAGPGPSPEGAGHPDVPV